MVIYGVLNKKAFLKKHIISEINMYARCGFFQYTGLAGQQ